MSSSILSRLFWTFAFLCLFLLVNFGEKEQPLVVGQSDKPEHNLDKIITRQNGKSVEPSIRDFPRVQKAYVNLKNLKKSEISIDEIDRVLEIAMEDGYQGFRVLKSLHLMKADLYEKKWHIHYAIESLLNAQKLQFDQRSDKRLKHLRKHLSAIEKERSQNQDYVATRFSGPAKTLTGKVLVAYIFVDDGVKTRWSDKSLRRSRMVLEQVQNWQLSQADRYAVKSVDFINKTFIVQRNPGLKFLSSISHKSSRESIEKLVRIVMEDLGARSVKDFIFRQMVLTKAEQGVVIIHSNFERRSFARRCGYTHRRNYYREGVRQVEMLSECNDEYVMLMEQVKRNRWDKLHYVQAHEMLHVFGADDLYSIEGASNYAVTDIMNFQSKYLGDSEISPITAYAIGWRDKKPKAPFRILDK